MIENGATDQREIEQEGAAFFTQFEAEDEAELGAIWGEGGVRRWLRSGVT